MRRRWKIVWWSVAKMFGYSCVVMAKVGFGVFMLWFALRELARGGADVYDWGVQVCG